MVDRNATAPDGTPDARGIPTYRSLGAALAAAPAAPHEAPWRVLVRRGHYDEKLTVDRPHVTLVGESEYGVVITHGDGADTRGADGRPLGTRGSYAARRRAGLPRREPDGRELVRLPGATPPSATTTPRSSTTPRPSP